MHRQPVWKLASAAVLLVTGASADACAQVVWTTFQPVVPVATQFAPIPTVAFAQAPVVQTVASPVIQSWGAPVVQTVASPVVVQPTVVAAPAVPVVTYFRAPTVVMQPVAQVQTRHRPILGGTVSRVRYSYMPVLVP